MPISILYPNRVASQTKQISPKMLYHLSIDRSFAYICADVKKRERFLAVISASANDEKEIVYRQNILKDLQKNASLLEQLSALSSRFEELRLSQRNADKDEYRLNTTNTASLIASKNILQAQALCLKRALLFVKAYGDILSKYELESQGLIDLYNVCRDIYGPPEFLKLIAFCSKYENFSANGFLDFKFSLNDQGRIQEYELIDHRYIHITDQELQKKGFSLFKKVEETNNPCARVNSSKDGIFESLAISALSELSELFGNINEQIFSKFSAIGRELEFYDVAMRYINALTEKKIPVCYPVFSTDNSIKVKNLYDLYLRMSKPNPADVTPNDFELAKGCPGLLVFGDSGSGKTVYLRSVGTMQLLAQAGLPIPCESAKITLFAQFATQFSESEKEFYEGNDAGRFEQEVRELATIVDTLAEGALVLLNETFQSTAYSEGAEAILTLLEHFSTSNIRWILVTHIQQLAISLDMGHKYKLLTFKTHFSP